MFIPVTDDGIVHQFSTDASTPGMTTSVYSSITLSLMSGVTTIEYNTSSMSPTSIWETTSTVSEYDNSSSAFTIVDDVLVQLYFWTNLIIAFAGYGLILHVIVSNDIYHKPHFYFMVIYIVGDMFQVFFSSIPAIVVTILKSPVPEWFCYTFGLLPFYGLLTGVFMLSLIAFERYSFVCKPFKYFNDFTLTKSALRVVFVFVYTACFTIGAQIYEPRHFQITTLSCIAEQSIAISATIWGFIILPSMIVTIFTTYKVFALRKKVGVAPAVVGDAPVTESDLPTIKQAVRLIAFTSGMYLISMIPAYIVITLIFRVTGLSWDDFDRGENVAAAQVLRWFSISLYSLVPCLNICVHLFTHNDLRKDVVDLVISKLACLN